MLAQVQRFDDAPAQLQIARRHPPQLLDAESLEENAENLLQSGYAASIELVTIEELQRHHEMIRGGFLEFYPQLRQHVVELAIET